MASRLTGNQFWKLRTKHGRDKIFSDAAVLWREACLYFEWCDNNPWEKVELVKYKGDYEEAYVPHSRPYSMDGLTGYLGVSGSYFRTAKSQLRDKIEKGKAVGSEVELLETIERIEQTVRTQQITGAMVGAYNPSITARLNGLVDRQDITTNGQAVLQVSVRDDDTADYLEVLNEIL